MKTTNEKTATTTMTKGDKYIANKNRASAIATAAHKLANVMFGTTAASATVVASTCYYTANTKHVSRKQKKQMAKVNNAACGVAIGSAAIGSAAKFVEGIAQPMPFDNEKYQKLLEEDAADTAEAVEAAEAAVKEKVEGAEQNAQ